jgi:hypothetical protein
MSYYKFGKDDVFYNTIKAYPKVNFIIYSGSAYYNNKNYESGAFSNPVLNVPDGHISLYELNVDRSSESLIYPWIVKGSDRISFKTVTAETYDALDAGDEIRGTYPLSSSFLREYIVPSPATVQEITSSRRLKALRNTIDFYRILSNEFQYSNSLRDLDDGDVNLISIPSIFYGSSIKKGSVDLKFYVSGTLVGQAKDELQNGELIQTGPVGAGTTVGLVLYNEGFLILTGSNPLSAHTEIYPPTVGATNPAWVHFGTFGSGSNSAASSSFSMDFQGTSYTTTTTMMAHAPAVAFNHSNNPTFLDKSSVDSMLPTVENYKNTTIVKETTYNIKNIVESPYNDYSASFQKQTYISRIGLYDKDKNLIAIAKVATPVRKRETDSYTFKLKLDI